MNRTRNTLGLAFALGIAALVLLFLWKGAPPEMSDEQLTRRNRISATAPRPAWKELDAYQNAITEADFIDQLTRVYSEGDAWKSVVKFEPGSGYADLQVEGNGRLRLTFAKNEPNEKPKRYWRAASELPPAEDLADKPLKGIHIAIDPGHIGGEWAKMEERWYQIDNNGTEVKEGELTLKTAQILKPKLEALGARVSLVRKEHEPVTRKRPDDFEELAIATLKSRGEIPEGRALQRQKEILFYRKWEIRRRAQIINGQLKPDLVLCPHFNASSWGDPANPQLTTRNDFHLLINGTYAEYEFRLEDNRFHLFKRLLQGIHHEELPLNLAVAATMAEETGLPPYIYPGSNAKRVTDDQLGDYIWARNLLANRIYHCPIVFLEPYIMNSRDVYARIGAGDYEGEREVAGKMRKSLFHEYADGVAEGLRRYYAEARK